MGGTGGVPRAVARVRWAVLQRIGRNRHRAVFSDAYERDLWFANGESRSGGGSTLDQTEAVRAALPELVAELGVRTVLDVPCGDFAWMRHVEWPDGVRYVGGDIVRSLVRRNQDAFADDVHRFEEVDLTAGPLPAADLVFCRDCLVHLSKELIDKALASIRASGATWLLLTNFTDERPFVDMATGPWRPINFRLPPFSFPEPERVLDERCTEFGGAFADKTLALWRIADLPAG